MNNKYLSDYINNNYQHVEGFCPLSALYALDHYASILNDDISIMEIGVHHGQFFIGLNQIATSTSYAIDVFDSQELNIDRSGKGDYEKFLYNLKYHDPRHVGSNVKIISGDSLDNNTFAEVSKCDVISVDGGHTPFHVVSDLTNAASLIKTTGIVILDDYFNHWWPSVTEGLIKYLQLTPHLVPFCSTGNKMWLCSVSYHDRYISHMKNIKHSFGKTDTKFFGHNIIDLW